jgi:hypothetical protein
MEREIEEIRTIVIPAIRTVTIGLRVKNPFSGRGAEGGI